MEKKMNSREIASIKKVFIANEKDYNDVAKLNEKIDKLVAERDMKLDNIDASELRVKNLTKMYSPDGTEYTSGELVEAVYTPVFNNDGTPKLDEKGYQMKTKKYVLKYGESLFPVAQEVVLESTIIENTTELA